MYCPPLSFVICCLLATAAARAQIELPPPIGGTFRVDSKGTGDDVFRDLAAAVRYLSLVGVHGDVDLVVAPGTHKGPLVLFPIPGQKAGQTVRIRAEGPGVRLESDSSIVRLMQGCHDLSFHGFEFGASGGEPTVWIDRGVTDIEIHGCSFLPETGGTRVIEVQGKRTTRRLDIHHNTFRLDGRHQYGIYTQGTVELFVHHNEFVCDGAREPVSIWNSNQSQSRVHDNVFRGSISSTCLRLDVSGHDVDVYRNLFLLRLEGARTAVIGSNGLANRAYNRIRHNVFAVLGGGVAIRARGPLAADDNSYAVQGGVIGQVNNTDAESLKEWQEAVAGIAVDDRAAQGSVVAGAEFFETHARLVQVLHRFDEPVGPEAVAPGPTAPAEVRAERDRAEVRFLVEALAGQDPVALRLAMHGLRRHGRRAAPAVPSLGKLCGHPHAPVRADAADLLGEIRVGAEIVIPELIRLLGDKDRFVLLAAVDTVRRFGHLARPAAPALEALTRSDDPPVQDAAKRALAAVRGE